MACDPTKDEMAQFLRDSFGYAEMSDFDLEEAIYWFAYSWHGGQASNLYSALCNSPFKPGAIANGPEPDSLGEEMLVALEDQYADSRDDAVSALPAYAVIIRAMHERGSGQRMALAELKRRGLWLTPDQRRQAGLASE